jgi:hypothetical protein
MNFGEYACLRACMTAVVTLLKFEDSLRAFQPCANLSELAYAWIGHKPGSGFSDMPRPALGVFAPWTGFELPSSWRRLPCYGADLNRNILDFMRWPQIDLGAQDLNDVQRPNHFTKIAGSKVRDDYYNTYLRK